MSLSTSTEAWIEVARSLGERGFLARYPGYFLLSSESADGLETLHETRELVIADGAPGLPRVTTTFNSHDAHRCSGAAPAAVAHSLLTF